MATRGSEAAGTSWRRSSRIQGTRASLLLPLSRKTRSGGQQGCSRSTGTSTTTRRETDSWLVMRPATQVSVECSCLPSLGLTHPQDVVVCHRVIDPEDARRDKVRQQDVDQVVSSRGKQRQDGGCRHAQQQEVEELPGECPAAHGQQVLAQEQVGCATDRASVTHQRRTDHESHCLLTYCNGDCVSRVNIVAAVAVLPVDRESKASQHVEDSRKDNQGKLSRGDALGVRVTAVEQLKRGRISWRRACG